jgi:hypothetical protein
MSLSSPDNKQNPSLNRTGYYPLMFAVLLSVLLSACGPSRTIRTTHAGGPLPVTGTLAQWPDEIRRGEQLSEFDYYVTNDDEFVYLLINFKNNRLYQNALRFGFTVYLDGDTGFKQSFGITYPAGILYGLSPIPGARKSYLENPGWSAIPENARMLQSIEDQMYEQALIISRSNAKAPIIPVSVNFNNLRAQDLELVMNRSGNVMTLEMKIPIAGTRARQFAIDPDGNTFLLGFEIKPPSYEEVTGENPAPVTADARQSQYDPYGRSRPENTQQISNPALYYQLSETYSRWVKVQLAEGRK